jgi:hypothetical protein
MKQLIGLALALTLTVMPTLAGAQTTVNYSARYPGVIVVTGGPPETTPPGRGGTPPAASIAAAIAVPNFIAYRDRSRTASSASDHGAPEEDVEPTGFLVPHALGGAYDSEGAEAELSQERR